MGMDKVRLHSSLRSYSSAEHRLVYYSFLFIIISIRVQRLLRQRGNAMTKWYEPVVLSLCPIQEKHSFNCLSNA